VEEFYFNNFFKTSFSVSTDNIHPLLDVTFDGVHILNNDIIRPNPTIAIELDDENKFLLMNEDIDTSNFIIEMKKPLSSQWERIYFSNRQGVRNLDWELANEENKFLITYEPQFTEDGTYGFRVQGQDKSGNISGDEPYQIFFEVIQESSITNIYNYPNPFSTKTHFVFTLTGNEIPNELIIQILNINGRLIKQIPLHELENIKIGNNITEYFWDGKDDFGDPLANGVYLYRVNAKIDNNEIKHRNSSGDHAFNKGFGKMYLIR
jgi:flagellar hook assembly protein FlgD